MKKAISKRKATWKYQTNKKKHCYLNWSTSASPSLTVSQVVCRIARERELAGNRLTLCTKNGAAANLMHEEHVLSILQTQKRLIVYLLKRSTRRSECAGQMQQALTIAKKGASKRFENGTNNKSSVAGHAHSEQHWSPWDWLGKHASQWPCMQKECWSARSE